MRIQSKFILILGISYATIIILLTQNLLIQYFDSKQELQNTQFVWQERWNPLVRRFHKTENTQPNTYDKGENPQLSSVYYSWGSNHSLQVFVSDQSSQVHYTLSPEVLAIFEKILAANIQLISPVQPEKYGTVAIPLKNEENEIIAYASITPSRNISLNDLDRSLKDNALFLTLILGVITFSSSGLVYVWLIHPIYNILGSLKNEEPDLLKRLAMQPNEIGALARRIQDSFLQRNALREEISKRTHTESILRAREHEVAQLIEKEEKLQRNLHDDLIQGLFAHGLRLEQCNRILPSEPSALREHLSKSRLEVNELIAKVRAVLEKNTAGIIHGTSLSKELQHLTSKANEISSTHFTLTVDEDLDVIFSPKDQKNIKSLINEIISNCIHHANANKCQLSLTRHGKEIQISAKDDGTGVNLKDSSNGHGLRNIRQRARELRANVDIISSPGKGFQVSMAIPLNDSKCPT